MKFRLPVRVGSVLLLGSMLVLGSVGVAGVTFVLTRSAQAPAAAPAAAPPAVTASYPVARDVTDYADFTARIAAVDSVEVRAHVWGYLEKVNFKEGALVQKGDVLFELDPRPYQAMLNQAQAKVVQDEAQLKYDEAEYQRNLLGFNRGVTAQSDLDKAAAARGVDIANVAADKAVVASRQLDLDYTRVTAPISGRVSRYGVTVGNLIQSGDQASVTQLTTIVSVDPMYAYFDMDERTVQRVSRSNREDRTQSSLRRGMARSGWDWLPRTGFPHQGTINFVDNQVNPKTGTLRVRGVFPNKDETLSPGFFCPRSYAHRPTPQNPSGQRPRARQRPGATRDPLRPHRQERCRLPAHPTRSPARRVAGHRSRPEAGRAGRRQRPANESAGHRRGAEALREHAGQFRDQRPGVRGQKYRAAGGRKTEGNSCRAAALWLLHTHL